MIVPEPPSELIDMVWLYGIMDRNGKSFKEFVIETAAEKKEILDFTLSATPRNPDERDRDNDRTVAYLARASWLHSKAGGFAEKAKGIVPWLLQKKGLNATMTAAVAPAFVADFREEASDWEAIIDSLHERLWTGRAEVKQQNRPGNY